MSFTGPPSTAAIDVAAATPASPAGLSARRTATRAPSVDSELEGRAPGRSRCSDLDAEEAAADLALLAELRQDRSSAC